MMLSKDRRNCSSLVRVLAIDLILHSVDLLVLVKVVPNYVENMAEDHPYKITTYTNSKLFAGTDSNVSVILYGSKGESGTIALQNGNNKDPFEKGSTDIFSVQAKDLGMIYKVKIFHDNSGRNPGWFLNKVVVSDGKTEKSYEFPCYRWLYKGENFSCEAILTTSGIPVLRLDDQKEENHKAHRTNKYKKDGLFLRRGQPFNLDLHLARDIDVKKDSFLLVLSTGNRPREINKTLVNISLLGDRDDVEKRWGYQILSSEGRVYKLKVVCPADALVGKFKLTVESEDKEIYEHPRPVYVLYNPWCQYEEVSMKDELRLQEYILREHGYLYVGNSRWQSGKAWYFGQFDEVTVDSVFGLLDDISPSERTSAVQLSRKMSALVNCNDDNGVLVGNWSGDYSGGKEPTFWTSSPPIFETYLKSGPVKYGQCWVFSAVLTSAMRCLGVPCRSLTNFNSAHDTEKNASHDVYLDEDGNELDRMTRDSIWNFHCWNDVWMERPDLPPGYGGWQAIDATPQERSRGIFQMGPTSLRAIKEGEIDFLYDTTFALAEVNSDVIMWQKNKTTNVWEAVDLRREHIGKSISTTEPGSKSRQDITSDYKFEEGSIMERAAVRKALKKAGNPSVRSTPREVAMKLDLPEEIAIGQDIVATVTLTSSTSLSRRVKLVVGGQVLRYNGIAHQKLNPVKKTVDLQGMGEVRTEFHFSAQHYVPHLNEHSSVRIFATFQAQETEQVGNDSDIIEIKKPSLRFEGLPKEIKNGQELKGHVICTNPLNETLNDCELNLDGSLWIERIALKTSSIRAQETHTFPVVLTIKARPGNRSLLASFTSKQLSGIYGKEKVTVVS